MADLDTDYRKTLKEQMDLRKQKNPRYSLRSFARLLNCDPTYLSKLNSGKLMLSVERANDFAGRLKLSGSERKSFILSAAEELKCHSLYQVDPSLTDCEFKEVSSLPRKRSIKPSKTNG